MNALQRSCAGKAGGVRQIVRTRGEQVYVRKAAAECIEIPRTVDVGELFQDCDEQRRECDRREYEERGPPVCTKSLAQRESRAGKSCSPASKAQPCAIIRSRSEKANSAATAMNATAGQSTWLATGRRSLIRTDVHGRARRRPGSRQYRDPREPGPRAPWSTCWPTCRSGRSAGFC